jgi:hypothetical protein
VSLRALTVGVLILASAAGLRAELISGREPSDARRVAETLARLRQAADPCGESAEVKAVLDAIAACRPARYEIRVSPDAERNLFDRPNARDAVRTILWNPDLRSELEARWDDGGAAVRREPAASLLHELVHAAHDCAGLDPGQYELEAVRIENIYRRAAGLAQRAGYGVELLPAAMRRTCEPGACSCDVPGLALEAALSPATAFEPMTVAPVADGGTSPVR